ncbi:hypothetical protein CHS0354_037577 [Potamilus streckersoni]|uniref:Cytochrome b-c1 complex subunit 7 n=1 Tax=Potamilus streckersoni TaxID=2493646 RepID=A0AAE0SUT7_9BIVA|nr:hypothetical protein CHS0354_037577 [Potamilus streckersoni]
MSGAVKKMIKKVVPEAPPESWILKLQKWAYYKSGFAQLGLWRDDCRYETPEVQEAIRRLPKDVYDARNFRMARALLLSNKKEILPKDEWTKFEEDVMYLKPYLNEIKKEKEEKVKWDRK